MFCLLQNLPFASQCELKPIPLSELKAVPMETSMDMNPFGLDMSIPPPGYSQLLSSIQQQAMMASDIPMDADLRKQ